jgi:hypothetical protein
VESYTPRSQYPETQHHTYQKFQHKNLSKHVSDLLRKKNTTAYPVVSRFYYTTFIKSQHRANPSSTTPQHRYPTPATIISFPSVHPSATSALRYFHLSSQNPPFLAATASSQLPFLYRLSKVLSAARHLQSLNLTRTSPSPPAKNSSPQPPRFQPSPNLLKLSFANPRKVEHL